LSHPQIVKDQAGCSPHQFLEELPFSRLKLLIIFYLALYKGGVIADLLQEGEKCEDMYIWDGLLPSMRSHPCKA